MYLEEMVMLPMLVPNLELVREAEVEVEVVVAQVLVQEAEVGLAVGLGQITDYKTATMVVTSPLKFSANK